MKTYEDLLRPMRACEYVWGGTKAYEEVGGPMKTYEDLWKPMRTFENIWRPNYKKLYLSKRKKMHGFQASLLTELNDKPIKLERQIKYQISITFID